LDGKLWREVRVAESDGQLHITFVDFAGPKFDKLADAAAVTDQWLRYGGGADPELGTGRRVRQRLQGATSTAAASCKLAARRAAEPSPCEPSSKRRASHAPTAEVQPRCDDASVAASPSAAPPTPGGAAPVAAPLEAEAVAAEAEGLRLHLSSITSTGYKGVHADRSRFRAEHRMGGKQVYLGTFDTAVEAAVAYARAVGAYQPPTAATAGYLAALVEEAEGLRLHLSSSSSTGYKGVYEHSGRFVAQDRRGGRNASLGTFDTAVEAAVAYARAVGQAAAEPVEARPGQSDATSARAQQLRAFAAAAAAAASARESARREEQAR